jgi:hypothetical protein
MRCCGSNGRAAESISLIIITLTAPLAARQKSNFVNPINAIPPVQSPSAKIFHLARRANHPYKLARSYPGRGAFRERHKRWGGMRWTQRRRETGAAKADGEVVWS